jgi:two-component system, LytTR family, sensor kinase
MKSGGRETLRLIALALVVGTFFTAQEAGMDLAAGRAQVVGQDLVNGLKFWVVWAFLAPAVHLAVRRWPLDARPIYTPIAAHLIVSIGLAALHNVIGTGLRWLAIFLREGQSAASSVFRDANPVAFVWGLFAGVVFYFVIVMVYTVMRYRNLYVSEQLSAAALESELTRSKLESLRSQLRPHFLFNTLNAISIFVNEDAGKAQQMILRLSTLLRRSLDEEAHEVPLEQELAFVNDYLDIQRARFGNRLRVHLAVDPAVVGAFVPVLLLQPLLENAIEHGRSDHECTTVVLSAGREGDMVHISLTDDGPGIRKTDHIREGVGLGNTRVRLEHLYGARASVQLSADSARSQSPGARVDIRIPFREGRT